MTDTPSLAFSPQHPSPPPRVDGFVTFLGFKELRSARLPRGEPGVKITCPAKIFWWWCQHKQAGALPPPSHPGAASCQPLCLCSCAWARWHGWLCWHEWLWPHGWLCQPGQPGRGWCRVGRGGRGGGRGSPAAGQAPAPEIYRNAIKRAPYPTIILMSWGKKRDFPACLSWLSSWPGQAVPLRIPYTTANAWAGLGTWSGSSEYPYSGVVIVPWAQASPEAKRIFKFRHALWVLITLTT